MKTINKKTLLPVYTVIAAVTALVVVTFVCPSVYCQEAAPDPDKWEFQLTPYLWMPSVSGYVTVKDHRKPIDLSFHEIMKDLQFGGMGYFEARHDNWAFFLDILGMKLSDDSHSKGYKINTDLELLLSTFEGGYRFGDKKKSFEVLAGARTVYADSDIVIKGVARVNRSKSWVDPLVGARVKFRPIDLLSFTVMGDIGGFGVGSKYTWDFVGTVTLHVKEHRSLDVGYRILDIDYESGHGRNKLEVDNRTEGPILGVTFDF